jgi:signal transduction histidine kinase
MSDDTVQILVVDDHHENLVALEAILAPLGHRVLLAESGREALKVLLHHEVALILLDVSMPDVDGYEVAELVRSRPSTRDTPIIFLTANLKSTSAMFKGYAVGAVDYIFKPLSAEVLISKVNVFVDLYRRSRALARQSEDLRRAHEALDLRVRERTDQLARANERLKREVAQRRRAELERAELLDRERAARQEAERVNRTKDEFLATLSHELRTPLNAILGWAHLLETTEPEPGTLTRGVKVIKNNALVQQQLIEDILDVSRIINGKMQLKIAPVDLRRVVEAALDTLRPAADAKRIEVVTTLPDLPAIAGDEDRLLQVVWNLLSNAIKFTPKDGRVEVTIDIVDSDIRLVVADNGRGIPAAFLPQIFDRFSQADSSLTRAQGGLGLGMAIVRHLVELHGGTVHAESGGENMGATFSVVLPTQQHDLHGQLPQHAPPQGADEDVSRAELPRLDGIHVLVVDNETDARHVAAAILRQQGGTVDEASSGAEALQLLASRRIDLIVSDIAMPVMDGYALMRHLRESSVTSRCAPAVALTASVTERDVAAAIGAGYQRHMAKPVSASDLVRVAAALCGRLRGGDEPSLDAQGAA